MQRGEDEHATLVILGALSVLAMSIGTVVRRHPVLMVVLFAVGGSLFVYVIAKRLLTIRREKAAMAEYQAQYLQSQRNQPPPAE